MDKLQLEGDHRRQKVPLNFPQCMLGLSARAVSGWNSGIKKL